MITDGGTFTLLAGLFCQQCADPPTLNVQGGSNCAPGIAIIIGTEELVYYSAANGLASWMEWDAHCCVIACGRL